MEIVEIKNNSIRAEIMKMLKLRLGSLAFWKRIEADIALKCSELIEPNNIEGKKKFLEQLKGIKSFILKQDVLEKDLKFIDDEIELHKNTRIISLYEEKDDSVEPEIIAGYARLGRDSEGMIAIPQNYNYSQLSKLTNGVYKETGLVKFYISTEQTIYGKVVAEIYEHSQEIPIATVVESKKTEKETGEAIFKGIKLFGQKYSKTEFNVIKEINLPFYVYRFITEDNNELILISPTQCEIGDYIITGVQTQCDDYKMLTDSARLPTKLPFFFAQKMKNRIIQFKNHEELNKKLKELNITEETFFDYPFTISKQRSTWKLLHPPWYKWLIWSWLTHQPKGIFNNYPMHIMIIGEKHSGKSLLLNGLHSKSKETRNIFSGSSSTLKHLVPSFKYNPAKLGYLAESNRYSFCDEFLRCLTNTRSTKEGSQREESVAIMNDLLEHQKREAGSGISKVNVNMTSRILATTNPIRDIKNVAKLINNFDESFLSRWLIYYQTKEHVQIVRRSKDSDLERYHFKIDVNDWISITDYLQTFSAEYDLDKVEKIHKSIPHILSEDLNKHYDARHMHHIECLIDGIIKTRCLLTGDMSFKAIDDDYKKLKDIWLNIIKSWLDYSQVKNVPLNEKINYLPENCQYIYWKICGLKKSVKMSEVKEIALNSMSKRDYYESWNILIEMGLMVEFDGIARPHYMSEIKDGNQDRLSD